MSTWQDRGKQSFLMTIYTLIAKLCSRLLEFFGGSDIVSVRIIEDREMQRPKGFGYVEFGNVEALKKALTLDGQSFQGRVIRIKVADPPRGGDGRGDSNRDLSDWTRKGPLPDIPGRSGRQQSDFGDRRSRDPAAEPRPAREYTWERRGPLSPLAQPEPASRSREGSRARPGPEGLGERGESHRGNRHAAGAWGEGRQEGSRPPRRENPERIVSAADRDLQWRERMRPDAPGKSSPPSRDGSEAPPSPSVPTAAPVPAVRPRLNLAKRTVSEAVEASTPSAGPGEAKASPFGAARPIDTAAKEKEIEEKRLQAIKDKREAEEKAKEEQRLAKQEAAAKAEAEAEKAAKEQAAAKKLAEEKAKAEQQAAAKAAEPEQQVTNSGPQKPNGALAAEAKVAQRGRDGYEAREPREPKDQVSNYKSRAAEAGNWRSASNEQRLGRGPSGGGRGGRGGGGGGRGSRFDNRGPRSNGSPAHHHHHHHQQQAGQQHSQQAAGQTGGGEAASKQANAPDEEGWTTVPNKKGRQNRALA
ncbi:hypothetical protein CDD82_5387 [Ophiocordyceps australis]|uniref:RRM domain-containing protein n=1 Tax=Ophiocordyceps australis TaxID=1399860 RepID=A0A2C5Z183_9HYPO|nr:hypothetical protein CDD82_5387 [Ophiocordyceps australis]